MKNSVLKPGWKHNEQLLDTNSEVNLNLAVKISSENKDIPIIEVLTGEKDSITNNYLNLDTSKVKADSNYLFKKLTGI